MGDVSEFDGFLTFTTLTFIILTYAPKTGIRNILTSTPISSRIVIGGLGIGRCRIVSAITISTRKGFSYGMNLAGKRPRFICVFCGSAGITSLLLRTNSEIDISTSALKRFRIDNSRRSTELTTIRGSCTTTLNTLTRLSTHFSTTRNGRTTTVNTRVHGICVSCCESEIGCVVDGDGSLAIIPMLCRDFNTKLPMFKRGASTVRFEGTTSSLRAMCPRSECIGALGGRTREECNCLRLRDHVVGTPRLNFPRIRLPSVGTGGVGLDRISTGIIVLCF